MVYELMQYKVQHQDEVSDTFGADIGIMIGDTLSPELWLLYMADFEIPPCNTPRLRGQEVDGASAQTERYRGSWTPAKSLQIPPDVNTTQSIE